MRLKDRFADLIGQANYVKYVMFLANLYRAFRPFRHPAAPLMRRLLIPRGGVALDIGANIGRCTALAAQAVGRLGKVYSFEPVPIVLRVLRAMVRLRGFRQVRIVEAALADKNGMAVISIPLKEGWKPLVPIAHLGGAPNPHVLNMPIAVKRLDDFCEAEGVGPIDFIKCDTEGGEFAVFSGGLTRLAKDLPIVVCEIYEEYLARQGVVPSALFGFFIPLGYQCYLIHMEGTLTPVKEYLLPGDYLFIHPTRIGADKLQPFVASA